MQKIVHPLLSLLASSDQQELVAQIRLLKAENQILRSKLPKRIMLSNQERQLIVKHGKPLGGKIKDVLSIVSYSTFRRWVRMMEDGTPAAKKKSDKTKSGRPRTEESIRDCIMRIRLETDWGYTKILQAMRRLGHRISRQTVKNILVEAGIATAPPSGDPDS